ncbi:efflux RND transporter permease subunit [Kistimonas scapharcae]|uniref:Efflux RND transporter permease subunit n=1 Tax=Kistimonas scapharcae TaxID=1036133 RepID=A0ABP8V6X4_9GAMM
MQLPRLAIQNHQFTLVITLLLIALGAVSLASMPRSEDPQFNFPAAMIKVIYPGTAPADMEKLVVDPIEEAINELDDLKVIKSDIEDGLGVVRVEFLYGTDPDEKYDDVVSAVSRIRDDLPDAIHQLTIEKISPTDVNILQIALMSDSAGYARLKRQAEKLEKRLERIAGIKRADIDGFPEQQVEIAADLDKMRALNISIAELANAIQSSSINLPGGHALSGEERFTVRTSGDFRTLQQIRRTAVRSKPGSVVYVETIADVRLSDALPTYHARFNGQRTVFVSVVQRKGSNIMAVMAALKSTLAEFSQTLPDDITLELAHDQSISVDERINGFFNNLLQGLALVGVMTVLALGGRAAFVIVLAIPMSVLIGIGWLDLSGFGLQQMSIVGLVVALGLLVDNAIVVTENVGRVRRSGHDSANAAMNGASQVGWAVVSGTLTTILSFFPILLLQTGAGTFLRSMPVTVILTLLASLVIALTLTPLLASKVLGKGDQKTPWLLRKIQVLANGPYSQLLEHSLKHPWRVLLLSVALLVGSLALVPLVGVSMFPKAEKPMLLVNIDMPENASFDTTWEMALNVESILRDYDIVTNLATNVGKGNPRIFYNIFPKRQVPNFAQILVQLDTGRLQVVEPFIEDIRQKFNAITGAKITIKEFMQGPPYEAPVSIRVVGDNLEQVSLAAAHVESIFVATPGTVNVDNPLDKPRIDLQVQINREKAAMLGVPISSIDQAVRASLVGQPVGQFRDSNGDDHTILVRAAGERPKVDTFNQIMVESANGALIPLNQLASLTLQTTLARLQHHNLERMARITADIMPGYLTEDITNEIIEQLDRYDWPKGVSYQVGGEQENRKDSFGGMNQVLLVALLGIFAVLVLQFQSFSQPLIIFTAIPFAVTGAIVALWLTGYSFSFTAFVGLTSLVGIVVNNSIILVDSANQHHEQGLSIHDAMQESARVRLVPILLTTLTTIGGLLPLTLEGSNMWSPMGWCIIGGLITSTLLTLIVVPVLYTLFSNTTERHCPIKNAQTAASISGDSSGNF